MKQFTFLTAALLLLASTMAWGGSEPPRSFPFEGLLDDEDGNPVADGSYTIVFEISQGASDEALWTEKHGGVPVENGRFSLVLGQTSPLPVLSGDDYWLSAVSETGTALMPLSASGATSDTEGVTTVTQPTEQAGGDLSGNYPNPTVSGIRGRQVAPRPPERSQILKWNGTAWVPRSETGNAKRLQTRPVSTTAPGAGQVLKWNGRAWAPSEDLTGGGAPTSHWTESGGNVHRVSGNVGIGTANPRERLHVDGNVLIEGGGLGTTGVLNADGLTTLNGGLTLNTKGIKLGDNWISNDGQANRGIRVGENNSVFLRGGGLDTDGVLNVKGLTTLNGGLTLNVKGIKLGDNWISNNGQAGQGIQLGQNNSVILRGGGLETNGVLNVAGLATLTGGLTVDSGLRVRDGSVTVGGTVVHSSDRRLKEDVRPITDPLERLSRLRGVSFKWRERAEEGTQLGFLGQEVERVYPELVSTGTDGFLGVNYSGLIAPLVESVKALKAENEQLKSLVCLDHPSAALCR